MRPNGAKAMPCSADMTDHRMNMQDPEENEPARFDGLKRKPMTPSSKTTNPHQLANATPSDMPNSAARAQIFIPSVHSQVTITNTRPGVDGSPQSTPPIGKSRDGNNNVLQQGGYQAFLPLRLFFVPSLNSNQAFPRADTWLIASVSRSCCCP